MAAIWKGSISFGLVNIPVELYGAVANTRPHFRLLHAKDKSPVSYERVASAKGSRVVDLMERLRRSLQGGGKAPSRAAAKRKKPRSSRRAAA